MTSNGPATAPATSDEGTSPADSATEPYAPDTRKPEDSSGETVSDGEGREHSALIWAVPCCAVAAGGIAAAVIAAKKQYVIQECNVKTVSKV